MKKILLRLLMVIDGFILIVFLNLLIFSAFTAKITEGVPITPTDSGHTALLVIDIQEGTTGTVSITNSFTEQSNVLIQNINRIISEAQVKDGSFIYIKSEIANPLINLLTIPWPGDQKAPSWISACQYRPTWRSQSEGMIPSTEPIWMKFLWKIIRLGW